MRQITQSQVVIPVFRIVVAQNRIFRARGCNAMWEGKLHSALQLPIYAGVQPVRVAAAAESLLRQMLDDLKGRRQ